MMKLSLRVITPICVRSGENASAIADYIYDPPEKSNLSHRPGKI